MGTLIHYNGYIVMEITLQECRRHYLFIFINRNINCTEAATECGLSGLDTLLVALLPGHRCAALHRDLGTAGGSRGPGDLEGGILSLL